MWASAERLLLSLWVGGLIAIGYLAVPVLFAQLDDRILAGQLAGRMFTWLSYLGLGCAPALLFITLKRYRASTRAYRLGLLGLMLVLVLIGEFVLQPMMAELKRSGIAPGTEAAAEFARLHGVSAIIYLLTSLLGLALVAWQPKTTSC